MPFGHHIIVNEIDLYIFSIILMAGLVGCAIGWCVGLHDGKRTLHDGWIIRNKHNMTKGL